MLSIEDPPSIERIGYFHFGDRGKVDPTGSLDAALRNSESEGAKLKNSLIVLPETFNVKGGFYGRATDPETCLKLQKLSQGFGPAFVVGLRDPTVGDLKGFNSAYLLDGANKPQLLAHKHSCTGDYCRAAEQHEGRTVLHRGIYVAALICDDAYEADQDVILRRFRDQPCAQHVLCIPAFMTTSSSLVVAQKWGSEQEFDWLQ